MFIALSGTTHFKNDCHQFLPLTVLLPHYFFYRLTIPLGLTILFVSAIPQYMGYGPFFSFNTGSVCKDEGWKIILYVNNFYEESGGVRVNQPKVAQLVLYAT